MNDIIRILMNRDGMTYTEAKETFEECRAVAKRAIEDGHPHYVDDILLDDLGLEIDYFIDLLF